MPSSNQRRTFDFLHIEVNAGKCSIPDDHIDPRRTAFFMARSVLGDSDHNLPLENLNIDIPLIALVGSEAPSRLQSILANKAASMIFKPILAFPPAVRKIIYTTNATESLDGVIRKTTKTRGSFTTDDAATKLIYLAIRNFEKAGRCV